MNIKSYSLNIKNFFSNSEKGTKKSKSNILISKMPSSPKTILVIFPIEQDFFRVASYSYRNLPYDRKNIEFHYLLLVFLCLALAGRLQKLAQFQQQLVLELAKFILALQLLLLLHPCLSW